MRDIFNTHDILDQIILHVIWLARVSKPPKNLENNYWALDEENRSILICCILCVILAFFFAVMDFGTIRALGSHLSSNKHLTFSWFGTWVLTSNGSWNFSSYLLFCPKRGQRLERCLFFFSQPPERSKPVQLGRCRELSRKWLVCDTKVRGVTCISVGRYDWPAGDLSSKKNICIDSFVSSESCRYFVSHAFDLLIFNNIA